MIPELKGIFLVDFGDFEEFAPEDSSDFSVSLRVLIGPIHQEAADSFNFTACSPDWLKREYDADGFVWRWDILILNEYNRIQMREIIERFVSRAAAPTWLQVGEEMSRRSNWEFDNYT